MNIFINPNGFSVDIRRPGMPWQIGVDYMSYRFNNTMHNLNDFIHVFLRFAVLLSTCSYIPGDKGEHIIPIFSTKFFCVIMVLT
jgi:hypothetical protein